MDDHPDDEAAMNPEERALFYAAWAGMLADELEPRRVVTTRPLPPIDWYSD